MDDCSDKRVVDRISRKLLFADDRRCDPQKCSVPGAVHVLDLHESRCHRPTTLQLGIFL